MKVFYQNTSNVSIPIPRPLRVFSEKQKSKNHLWCQFCLLLTSSCVTPATGYPPDDPTGHGCLKAFPKFMPNLISQIATQLPQATLSPLLQGAGQKLGSL